jgi:type II restriction enzyme
LFIPKSNGTGALGETLSTPLVGRPLTGCTESFIQIGPFESQTEAQNCLKYIKTKLCRALLGTLKVTQDNPKSVWKNIPLQDFTSSSDIDWSQSVADIDSQLYAKYGLSEEEIGFIEGMIKVMG